MSPIVRTHTGADNQAAAVIAWPTGGGVAQIADSRRLDVLAAVFSDRLIDQLRSQAGISYSTQVVSTWPAGLASGGRLMAVGQVPPEKTAFSVELVRKRAADLAATPKLGRASWREGEWQSVSYLVGARSLQTTKKK